MHGDISSKLAKWHRREGALYFQDGDYEPALSAYGMSLVYERDPVMRKHLLMGLRRVISHMLRMTENGGNSIGVS